MSFNLQCNSHVIQWHSEPQSPSVCHVVIDGNQDKGVWRWTTDIPFPRVPMHPSCKQPFKMQFCYGYSEIARKGLLS